MSLNLSYNHLYFCYIYKSLTRKYRFHVIYLRRYVVSFPCNINSWVFILLYIILPSWSNILLKIVEFVEINFERWSRKINACFGASTWGTRAIAISYGKSHGCYFPMPIYIYIYNVIDRKLTQTRNVL